MCIIGVCQGPVSLIYLAGFNQLGNFIDQPWVKTANASGVLGMSGVEVGQRSSLEETIKIIWGQWPSITGRGRT